MKISASVKSEYNQHEVQVETNGSAKVLHLIRHTDRVAEIHNTLRKGVNVTLTE